MSERDGEQTQYEAVHAVSRQGGQPEGRGQVREVPEEEVRNYYGRAVLKEPTWTWEIPAYFFAGGLAGASAGLALTARLAGNDKLARRTLLAALGGAAASPIFLISDLGRPERFYNMLRAGVARGPTGAAARLRRLFGGERRRGRHHYHPHRKRWAGAPAGRRGRPA